MTGEQPPPAEKAGTGPPSPDPKNPATYPADDPPDNPEASPVKALLFLLRLSPFIDLYQRAGKVSKSREWVCFTLDALIRFVATVLLLGLILLFAWKLLAPFPPFRFPGVGEVGGN